MLNVCLNKTFRLLLGIGPILGLFVVNLIGSASDRWSSKYGRRRPFIWLLCFGVILSLIIIPYAKHLASLTGHHRAGMEVFFLILGIGLLDSCGQVCFTPLEALLSDLFPEGEACRKAFSFYALTVGIGACIGYLLPSVDWTDSWLAKHLGGQEKCLFTLLLVIFSGCIVATFFVSEEVWINGQPDICLEPASKGWTSIRTCPLWSLPHRAWRMALALRSMCALVSRFRMFCCRVPVTLWRLFMAQLCSWMALMTFTLFYTDFIGEGLYHGVPIAAPGTEARLRYDEGQSRFIWMIIASLMSGVLHADFFVLHSSLGVRMGSLGLFLQSVISILFSFSMDYLVRTFGTRFVYLVAVSCLPIAAIITCFSNSITMVTASAAMTGIPFSVLQILPYTLTSLYHHNRQVSYHTLVFYTHKLLFFCTTKQNA